MPHFASLRKVKYRVEFYEHSVPTALSRHPGSSFTIEIVPAQRPDFATAIAGGFPAPVSKLTAAG